MTTEGDVWDTLVMDCEHQNTIFASFKLYQHKEIDAQLHHWYVIVSHASTMENQINL